MNNEAQKMRFEYIDQSFANLKQSVNSQEPLRKIENELYDLFRNKFFIRVVNTKRTDPCFVMSIFPEKSTIDKIVESITLEQNSAVISELWKANKLWIIEIDRRVLDDSVVPISARECTALLMHEVGHVVNNNTIPNRISRVLKYEFAKMDSGVKSVLKDSRFKRLLSLPIFDSCTMSSEVAKENLKAEVAADSFAKSMGYDKELLSVLDKFIAKGPIDPDKSMRKVTQLSVDIIKNFQARKAYLNRNWFNSLLNRTPSEVIREELASQMTQYTESLATENYYHPAYMESVCDTVNNIIDNYYQEFFLMKKNLKKLPEYDIDYIAIEIEKIKTHDDKLLIVSYIRNKIDTAQYYIDILLSDKYSKKYNVPHSMEYLTVYKTKMTHLLTIAMEKKIIPKKVGIVVGYPEGYEG